MKTAVSSLNKDKIFVLKTLSKNNDLIIQKSDNGNSIVLINKSDYIEKNVQYFIRFQKIVKFSAVDEKHLNFIIGTDKKLTNLLKGYLRYKTITSQNVPSEVQVKNFFIS